MASAGGCERETEVRQFLQLFGLAGELIRDITRIAGQQKAIADKLQENMNMFEV